MLNMNAVDNLAFGVIQSERNNEMHRIRKILKSLQFKNQDVAEEVNKAYQRLQGSGEESEASDSSEDLEANLLQVPKDMSCCTNEEPGPDNAPNNSWQTQLTYTDQVRLHIARALVMNPEVMVLQRPLFHFNQEEADNLMMLLQEHCKNRGLGMPPESVSLRRPRTVFLSVDNEEEAERADVIWRTKDTDEKFTFTVVP